MEYIAVLNNNLEYSLDDNQPVNLSFQSTSMPVFHATESINAVLAKTFIYKMVFILVHSLNLSD